MQTFRPHCSRLLPGIFVFLSALSILLADPAGAGQNEQAKKAPTAPPELKQPVEPNVEALQSRLEVVKEADGLEDDTRKQLQNMYQEALTALKQAKEYASALKEYKAAVDQAPEQIKSIKDKLEESPPALSPNVPEDASVSDLEQKLAHAQAELEQAKAEVQEIEAEKQKRTGRQKEIPQLLTEARKALQEVEDKLDQEPASDANPMFVVPRRVQRLARQKNLQNKIKALEAELKSYNARGDLLPLRRDLTARRISRAEKLVEFWQERVNEARRESAARAAEEAEEARREAALGHPVVQELADKNAELAARRTGTQGLAAKIEEVSQKQAQVDALREELSTEFNRLKEKVEAVGLTKAVGLLLLQKRAELPEVSKYHRSIEQRQEKMSQVQFEWMELEGMRSDLSVLDERLEGVMQKVPPSLPEWQREEIRREVRKLLETRRGLLDDLISDYRTYFRNLVDLDNSEQQLVDMAEKFTNYVQERVLWVQSIPAVGSQTIRRLPDAVTGMVAPAEWVETLGLLWKDVRGNLWLPLMFIVILGALLWARPTLQKWMVEFTELLHNSATDSFALTVKACIYTLLIALPIPLVLLFFGWRLVVAARMIPGFTLAAGHALTAAGAYYLALAVFSEACNPDGLLEDHFRMSRKAVNTLRGHFKWFLPVTVISVFILVFTEWLGNEAWSESLGRVVFMVCMLGMSAFVACVLRPTGRVVGDLLRRHRRGWLERSRYIWYGLAVVAPISLAIVAAFGYYYGAQRLAFRLQLTLGLFVGIGFINALVVRWLVMTRRRIAVQRAEARRAEREKAEAAEQEDGESRGAASAGEPEQDLYNLSVQTRRFLMAFLLVALGTGLWLIWADILPALAMLDRIQLWTITDPTGGADGQIAVTLGGFVVALVLVLVSIFAARNVPGLLEIAVLQHLPVDQGVRFAVSTLTKYAVVVVGLVMAFGQLGIGWSKVQWLIAAMTVGLGFGLQEIFANFISGLIILFEQPVRVGDTITVGEVFGTVTRIRIRATTIQQWDRRELIVPNKEFITGRLINWTLSDTILRMEFPVGIAYGSDTEKAEKLLYRVAQQEDKILDDPAPRVVFKGFGDSALEFELRAFIPNLDDYVEIWHTINRSIDDTFREGGIEISFPQRDLHLRSVKRPFPVKFEDVKRADEEGGTDET